MQDHTTEPSILDTRIPEGRAVPGIEYGAHYSDPARRWLGYYVRAGNSPQWGIARLTPASDELEESDAATVRAIAEELERVNLDQVQRLASDAMNYGRRHGTGAEIVRQAVRDGIADQRLEKTVIPFADGSMLAVQATAEGRLCGGTPTRRGPERVSPNTRDSILPPNVKGW